MCRSIDGTWYVHKIKDLSGNTTINTEKDATQFAFEQKDFIVTGYQHRIRVLLFVLGNQVFGWVHREEHGCGDDMRYHIYEIGKNEFQVSRGPGSCGDDLTPQQLEFKRTGS